MHKQQGVLQSEKAIVPLFLSLFAITAIIGESEAAEENAVARLRKMMKVLTPQQQDILRMTLDGLKVKDIAAALGVTDNTVKMQKKRAYTTLRERFGKAGAALLVMFFRQRRKEAEV